MRYVPGSWNISKSYRPRVSSVNWEEELVLPQVRRILELWNSYRIVPVDPQFLVDEAGHVRAIDFDFFYVAGRGQGTLGEEYLKESHQEIMSAERWRPFGVDEEIIRIEQRMRHRTP
jgi:hypothetical protein